MLGGGLGPSCTIETGVHGLLVVPWALTVLLVGECGCVCWRERWRRA